jgi:hypothetical protein
MKCVRLVSVVSLFCLSAFPLPAGKEPDVEVCAIPIIAQVTKNPPRPGQFWTHVAYQHPEQLPPGLDGYLGVSCETPGAQHIKFHHSFTSGWNPQQ